MNRPGFVIVLLVSAVSGFSNVVFTLGNNPQANEQTVLFSTPQIGSTVFGLTNMTGERVAFFSSTDTLVVATSGQSPVSAQDGLINDIDIARPFGGTFQDLIIDPFGGSGAATVTVHTNDGHFTFAYPGGLGSGNNFLTITTTGGEIISGIEINAPSGFTDLRLVNMSGLGSTVILPGPNITKSFTPASVVLGNTTMLTFTINNPNSFPVGEVGLFDALPSGINIDSAQASTFNACGGGTVHLFPGGAIDTLNLVGGTLAAGASCMFSVTLDATALGPHLNCVQAESAVSVGAESCATVTVLSAPPQLAPPIITKKFLDASIPVNGTTSLSFIISNPNSVALTSVAFADPLGAFLHVVGSPSNNTCTPPGTIDTSFGQVSLTGATLAANASCSFTVNVEGIESDVYINTVAATDTLAGTGKTATATLTTVGGAILGKIFSVPGAIPINGSTSLIFNIMNPNSTTTLTNVHFSDTLPAGLLISTPNGLSGSCGGGTITANAGSINISLTGATLALNASCSFSVNVTGTAPGTLKNTTGPVIADQATGDTASATLAVVAPPTLAKAFGTSNLQLGNSTTLSFTLTNPTGNPSSFTNLTFSDTLPAGLTISTPNGLMGSCGGGTITATAGTNLIQLMGATLAAGASCTFSVNVTAATPGVQNNVTSTVSDAEGVFGGAASATTTVVNPPTISKAFADTTLDLFGPPTTLSFTVGNPNTTTLTGLAFFDTLPVGVSLATPDSGLVTTCAGATITAPAGGTTITMSDLTLTGGATCTISVQVVGAQLGTFTNTTSPITAFGGTVVGNAASASVEVRDLYFMWFFLEGGGGSKGKP
jgi:hypothetical protein